MVTLAKAPGKPPRLPEAMRHALRNRFAQPQGFARDKALWHWLGQA